MKVEAEIIKRISPVAWRHVNLLGRFEFHRQQNLINMEEMIGLLEDIDWQRMKETDKPSA
jgi:hypothetical protein